MSPTKTLPAVLVAIALLSTAAHAEQKSAAECERDFKPKVGQAGKDVIWVPTPDELVNRMLKMAKTTSKDFVVDLGAGDGKIAIAAGRDFGARALGIEYNAEMVKLANCMARVEGVTDKVEIKQGDIFKEDFSKADVVTMYLLPQLNLCVRHRLLAMAPGTRVTSHAFNMGDWPPDQTAEEQARTAYLWIVPARVAGSWSFTEQGGDLEFTVNLNQTFQKINGEATISGAKQPLVGAMLNGEQIRFAFNDGKGVTRTVTGSVRGKEISGAVRAADGKETRVSGALQGEPKVGGWAQMAEGCERFYK